MNGLSQSVILCLVKMNEIGGNGNVFKLKYE